MTEMIVAGRRVTIRDEYPFNEFPDLISLYRGMKADTPQTVIPVARQMVTGWEFQGDPTTDEAYQSMDAIALWGLFRGVNGFWVDRLYADPQPLPVASTST
jgi:hypothetical protein